MVKRTRERPGSHQRSNPWDHWGPNELADIVRKTPVIPWIIPGDRGKVEPGWLTPPLGTTRVKARVQTGVIHQFLWRRSRAVSDAKQELRGQER
jgi:hypothetical protein